MRPVAGGRLYLTMMGTEKLEVRLAELVMTQLSPCDLGDGIEVLHEVESLEIEMDCDLADPSPAVVPLAVVVAAAAVDDLATTQFTREEAIGTHQFVRVSAPYERIEIQLDGNAFLRATIEDAKTRNRRH